MSLHDIKREVNAKQKPSSQRQTIFTFSVPCSAHIYYCEAVKRIAEKSVSMKYKFLQLVGYNDNRMHMHIANSFPKPIKTFMMPSKISVIAFLTTIFLDFNFAGNSKIS